MTGGGKSPCDEDRSSRPTLAYVRNIVHVSTGAGARPGRKDDADDITESLVFQTLDMLTEDEDELQRGIVLCAGHCAILWTER